MRPLNIVVIINTLFFLLIYLFIDHENMYILAAGAGLTLVTVLGYYIIKKAKMGDPYLFLIISLLSSIGITMIYRLNPSTGLRQILWYVFGVILFFLSYVIFIKIRNWESYVYLYIAGGLLLFLLTFTLGTTVKGATNWIRIGNFTFQPAEIIKIIYVFFIAAYFTYPKKLKNVYIFTGIAYLHILLLFFQRDLGMAMLFYGIFLSVFYVFSKDQKLLLLNIAGAFAIVIVGYYTMNHVQIRFEAWINPWENIASRGYQITQSLFAIAEGGFFGTGLGMGRPDFIPEVHTDFIFSAICEEMGLFGGIGVVLLYFILVYRGFKIVLHTEDKFKRIVALGITLTYSYQTFIIIGGVIKLIPLTGITLPFVSYGGSSLVTAFIAFGILQGISKNTQMELS
ncbi:FtsW/RodA/SpoVE family cell cycle protein [Serpentinicella sp. ANB-PHB4]|uniref:FtsW/RodA/SpoVE family cell cycle protein n=1 Tax=Serpentinicella sp. ANB-PHB4 TaxID=3074076 RepID=UPI00285A412C|nr:FtsW/RodA/SpoVE family cell cycle protein [Serpentinicella sp. ANB-PHB4]MDR5659727.1 FtsW/RodA/SpoVE family cell cycle protein [Serpentinicella sp. ANB-PHB4]